MRQQDDGALSSPLSSQGSDTVRMRVSAHCTDAFLNVSFSGFYRTGVRRLRPVRRQRTLCGIRIKSFGALFVSAPLCGDSDLCDPDRNKRDVEFVDEAGREAKGEVVEL